MLRFEEALHNIEKIKKLLEDASPLKCEVKQDTAPPLKSEVKQDATNSKNGYGIKKGDAYDESSANVTTDSTVWLKMFKFTLLVSDKQILTTTGLPLTDKHVNLSQAMLKKQFLLINGLQSTLFQSKKLSRRLKSGVQVIFCRNNHWITVYKSESDAGLDIITVYDSIFTSVNEASRRIITNLFDVSEEFQVVMGLSQKQEEGSNNCGLFAIAVATTLAFRNDPSELVFVEREM